MFASRLTLFELRFVISALCVSHTLAQTQASAFFRGGVGLFSVGYGSGESGVSILVHLLNANNEKNKSQTRKNRTEKKIKIITTRKQLPCRFLPSKHTTISWGRTNNISRLITEFGVRQKIKTHTYTCTLAIRLHRASNNMRKLCAAIFTGLFSFWCARVT